MVCIAVVVAVVIVCADMGKLNITEHAIGGKQATGMQHTVTIYYPWSPWR